MRKEERLETFRREVLSQLQAQALEDAAEAVWLAAYDQGFADGVAAGSHHTAQALDFVTGALTHDKA